jgi:hypothetical protein
MIVNEKTTKVQIVWIDLIYSGILLGRRDIVRLLMLTIGELKQLSLSMILLIRIAFYIFKTGLMRYLNTLGQI